MIKADNDTGLGLAAMSTWFMPSLMSHEEKKGKNKASKMLTKSQGA